jgi:nucleotide-binding universal stress UspA family protein
MQETKTSRPQLLQIKTILVPVDFSRASMHALKYTIPLAEEFNAAIHLVHVQPADEFTAIPGAGRLMLNCADAVALMQDRLAEVQEKDDVKFCLDNCHVVSGRPYQEICKLAGELAVDLIVLPTRGHSGLKRLALGSTAERVVRHAPCPVLIPRGSRFESLTWSAEPVPKFAIHKILATTDFSDASIAGVKYAALLAKQFHAKLRLVHVVFPYTQVFQMDRMGSDLVPLIQNARLQAEKELTRVRQLEFMDGVECETEVRTGSTIDEICAASGQPDIDLLVTSTHGYTGFSHAMIGSIAEHIVRYAESPVLVVPARSHE